MKCYFCGKKLPDSSKFCQYCGKRLNVISPEKKESYTNPLVESIFAASSKKVSSNIANIEDVNRLYTLGCNYYNGKGVEKNYRIAVQFFSKAANLGHPDSQCFLGYCCEFGEGTTKDIKKATKNLFKYNL